MGIVRASDDSCNNAAVSVLVVAVWARVLGLWPDLGAPAADDSSPFTPHHRFEFLPVNTSKEAV